MINLNLINVAAFYESLDTLRQSRRLRWREVATQSGVNASILNCMAQGIKPDEESLAALVMWTGWSELQLSCCLTKIRESQSKSEPQTLLPESFFSGSGHYTPEAITALKAVFKAGTD